MYHIIDTHTGAVVGKAKTLRAALRSVDRRDNAYGAYRYRHRRVEPPLPSVSAAELAAWTEGEAGLSEVLARL